MNNINIANNNDFETIWIKKPYLGDKGDQLLISLKTKSKHHFTKEVKFRIIQSTQKLRFYTNMKDQTAKLMKSYDVYHFNCPGCNHSYISKTKRNLCTRTGEHACSDKKVPFTTILTTAVIIAILKIFSVSILIHLIKHYLLSTQSKVTPK